MRCSIARQGLSLHNALMPEGYAIESKDCHFGTAKRQWRRHVGSSRNADTVSVWNIEPMRRYCTQNPCNTLVRTRNVSHPAEAKSDVGTPTDAGPALLCGR